MILDTLLVVVLLICVYTDVRFNKIYNVVVFPAVAAAVVGSTIYGGLSGSLASIKGLLLGIALLFIPFAAGGFGAGDVKLLGVIGAFKGPEFVWQAFLAAALTGGLISLIMIVRTGNVRYRLRCIFFTMLSLLGIIPKVDLLDDIHGDRGLRFPYGIAIVAGAALTYLLR
jgi:prepilin peptidase CpaA